MNRMEYKDKIIAAVAEKACEHVATNVIKVLRADKESRLSGDDSGLQNVWDEICVQIRGESSIYWDDYLDTAKRIIQAEAGNLDKSVIEAIWLQTDKGEDWDRDNQSDEEANIVNHSASEFPFIDIVSDRESIDNKIPESVEYDMEDIAEYIWDNYVYDKASNFTNKRIEKYLEGDRDSF